MLGFIRPPVKQSIIHFSSLISLRALTIVLPSINPLSRKDIVFSLAFPPVVPRYVTTTPDRRLQWMTKLVTVPSSQLVRRKRSQWLTNPENWPRRSAPPRKKRVPVNLQFQKGRRKKITSSF